jgi:hypothetical protein
VIGLRTIERAVAPLRQALEAEARATIRFETPLGRQLQIDFGETLVLIGGETYGCTCSCWATRGAVSSAPCGTNGSRPGSMGSRRRSATSAQVLQQLDQPVMLSGKRRHRSIFASLRIARQHGSLHCCSSQNRVRFLAAISRRTKFGWSAAIPGTAFKRPYFVGVDDAALKSVAKRLPRHQSAQ